MRCPVDFAAEAECTSDGAASARTVGARSRLIKTRCLTMLLGLLACLGAWEVGARYATHRQRTARMCAPLTPRPNGSVPSE